MRFWRIQAVPRAVAQACIGHVATIASSDCHSTLEEELQPREGRGVRAKLQAPGSQ